MKERAILRSVIFDCTMWCLFLWSFSKIHLVQHQNSKDRYGSIGDWGKFLLSYSMNFDRIQCDLIDSCNFFFRWYTCMRNEEICSNRSVFNSLHNWVTRATLRCVYVWVCVTLAMLLCYACIRQKMQCHSIKFYTSAQLIRFESMAVMKENSAQFQHGYGSTKADFDAITQQQQQQPQPNSLKKE